MFKKATLQIITTEVSETIAFYQDILGFQVLVTVPPQNTSPIMAMLTRDGVDLTIQSRQAAYVDLPAIAPDTPPTGCSVILYIEMTDGIEDLFAAVQAKAAPLTNLHNTAYGTREFYVRDPNGTLLAFAQPI